MTYTFDDWKKEQHQDPEFCKALEELSIAYQLARLRMLRELTQAQLAKKVGVRLTCITRLENGKSQLSVKLLRRIAAALGARLDVRLIEDDAG